MAWIPSDVNMGRHPKTRRFARELGVSVPAAMGHLHLFWHWCMEFASNGYVTQHDVTDIADAALWGCNADDFMNALIECKFIDKSGNELKVHDWDEYGGRYLEKKNTNAERQAKYRERKKVKQGKGLKYSNGDITPNSNSGSNGDSNSSNGDITVMSHENNALEKNRIEKNRIEKSTSADADDVRAQEKKPVENSTASSSSSSVNSEFLNLTPERQAMLDSVLDLVNKKSDWYGKTLAEAERRIIAKILNKIERDGRTLEQINGYMANFARMVDRDQTTVTKPYPAQMLKDMDRVLDWKPIAGKQSMTEQEQLARMAELTKQRMRNEAKAGVA